MASDQTDFRNLLNPVQLQQLAQSWINEDLSSFDIQGFLVGDKTVTANIYCKQPGVLAGKPFVNAVFQAVGTSITCQWLLEEGSYLSDASLLNKVSIASVTGPANRLLLAERTVLNVLSRCSGVATVSRRVRTRLDQLNWSGQLAGTRKTTPGFRSVEKYGLIVGGAGTHRYDLSSMVMLKDNHVKISGQQNMIQVIQKAKKYIGFNKKLEVECSSLKEAMDVAQAGADIVMLDNLTSSEGRQVAHRIKQQYPNLLIEASGGITESNFHKYAVPEIDIISMSCLVQGYSYIDFSMKVEV